MNIRNLVNIFSNKKEMLTKPMNYKPKGSLHNFSMKTLEGKTINFEDYKGKKVVIINVASKCGYTPQYADWQKFHDKYGEQIAVIGVPANNFLGQEPGTNADIATFCERNYGVTFPITEKVDVIGSSQHPLFAWLSKAEKNGWNDKAPSWNFCKYVINEEGHVTHFFASSVKPDKKEFKEAVDL